jgi:hypothetical protein
MNDFRLSSADDIDIAWQRCLDDIGMPGLRLLAESSEDRARRTFIADEVVYKVTLLEHTATQHRRTTDLRGEYEFLLRCKGIPSVPHAIGYRETGTYQLLAMHRFDGTRLADSTQRAAFSIKHHWTLLKTVCALARRGIAHNDITPSNVLVGANGALCLLDFDQARSASRAVALCSALLGIGMTDNIVHGSYVSILKNEIRKALPPRVVRGLKRLLGKVRHTERLPVLDRYADHTAKELYRAWDLAQLSNANSPGGVVAYYSLKYKGYTFPGERCWEKRWQYLRGAVDLQGKRVLELGCNMGLLSCYALKEERAQAALGVDVSATVLKAARHVAAAFQVPVEFRRIDFDSSDPWDVALADFQPDIVFALNVLNWLREKDRFLRFLGRFGTVIVEGHDEPAVEVARLRNVGFGNVHVLQLSERGRPILVARRQP